MKKFRSCGGFWYNLLKTMRIMRLSLFLIVLSTVMAYSSVTYSQSTKITLNLINASVKETIKAIEDQSEFLFFYQEKHLDFTRQISIEVVEQNIETVLDEIFAGTDVIYRINDRQVVLTKGSKKEIARKASKLINTETLTPVTAQQQREITGRVVDKDGFPLPGVAITVKDRAGVGTVTDPEGRYTIRCGANETLVFSFIGLKAQEHLAGDIDKVTVTLEEDVLAIEEVQVVAFGKQKKASVVSSISAIGSIP